MAINVNRGVLDPFYRYKMPKILAKVEGKGNGIKTVIANMSDIAKALERPPSYPTKYFGFELGAQTNIDLKNDRYIVNGEHDANKLQEILDGFIKKFVLCPSCDNPETALRVKKNQINSKCKACGHAFVIDSKLRLASFIVKNPPTADVVYEKAAKAADKVAATAEEVENGVEVETVDRHSSDGADDDDDWAEPTGQLAIGEEETRLAAGVGKLVISKDLEKSTEERLDMLHQYFTRAKAEGKVDGKEFLNEAERLDLKQKAPLLLVEAFLDGKILEEDELKTMRNVFLRFTVDDPKAQRYLLGGIEQLIMNHEATLLPKAAHVIKRLYDYDIVEEETLLAWGEKPSSKYVPKANAKKIIANCEAVLKWLKDAEEESEDEDEEDDEIDFQKDNKKSEMKEELEERARRAAATKVAGDDGEELDIDDI
ncbi:hypothetical protein PRIPAC_73032 [Pristionchus pacificus]|uniref:Eukaryotic translation initiation factor 5 n=1 Tax=Pristionchus pacificus TaxID=54126 RepID=A0A2A6C1P4_PRIPA|nr:hypothetical protein PRIPAC_73032 [Pristionchus pacificus]|eukprot:PDM71951.1 hypothetical protein PRIPAC_38358 [Pristionchus pacificus]